MVEPGLSRVFQVGQNTTRDLVVDFDPEFIAIDNPGSYWIHFPQTIGAFQWIRPGVFNAIVPAPNTGRAINITTSDVPVGYPAPAVSLALATLTVYARGAFGGAGGGSPLSPNPGVPGVLVDTNAADIKATGKVAGAGASGQAADAGHIHPGAVFAYSAAPQTGAFPFNFPFITVYGPSGILLYWVSTTAIKLNGAGLMKCGAQIDAGAIASWQSYSDVFGATEQKPMPVFMNFTGGLAAGAHTLKVSSQDVNTGSDANTWCEAMLMEIAASAN